jgi:hypothetical protein
MDVASGFAFGYDPTGRSVIFIKIDKIRFVAFEQTISQCRGKLFEKNKPMAI